MFKKKSLTLDDVPSSSVRMMCHKILQVGHHLHAMFQALLLQSLLIVAERSTHELMIASILAHFARLLLSLDFFYFFAKIDDFSFFSVCLFYGKMSRKKRKIISHAPFGHLKKACFCASHDASGHSVEKIYTKKSVWFCGTHT